MQKENSSFKCHGRYVTRKHYINMYEYFDCSISLTRSRSYSCCDCVVVAGFIIKTFRLTTLTTVATYSFLTMKVELTWSVPNKDHIDIGCVRKPVLVSHKLSTLARSPLLGACNSHNKPMQRHFYRPVYF